MRAAIYARKSTDDNDRDAENKSVTRQVERALAFAKAHAWTVGDEHVYIDDGISGAEFRNRPARRCAILSWKLKRLPRLWCDGVCEDVRQPQNKGAADGQCHTS